MLIDFHNHVLPDADDGSKSLEMSLNMLRTAAEQGITDVVNTIHYQHPKLDEFRITNEELQIKIKELQDEVDKTGIPIKLHQGTEVFYLPNLVKIARDPVTTIGNGKYMLVEFQFHQLPEGYRDILFNLVMQGVTPIIAHPERYKPIQRDLSIVRDLLGAGCLLQMDAGSIVGSLGQSSQKAAVELLKQGLFQLMGSDAHDDRGRSFCLAEAVEICRGIIGDQVDIMVTENPLKLIQGEVLEPDVFVVRPPVVQRSMFGRIVNFIKAQGTG